MIQYVSIVKSSFLPANLIVLGLSIGELQRLQLYIIRETIVTVTGHARATRPVSRGSKINKLFGISDLGLPIYYTTFVVHFSSVKYLYSAPESRIKRPSGAGRCRSYEYAHMQLSLKASSDKPHKTIISLLLTKTHTTIAYVHKNIKLRKTIKHTETDTYLQKKTFKLFRYYFAAVQNHAYAVEDHRYNIGFLCR